MQSAALAEPTAADKETARNLMKEGDDKFAAKDFAGALKAYQAAHAIMKVPTTGLPLAKAQIERGLLLEARDTLLDVSRMPKEAGEKPAFAQARDEAAQLAQKLADRIPSVQISVDGPAPGAVSVSVNGVSVPTATLGTPRKVNPGQNTIVASASGFQTVTKTVTLKEGDNEKIALQLKSGSSGPAVAGGGTIRIESPSEPGNVIVDGKAVGATPLDVPVTAGSHKVEIEYPGGSHEQKDIDVAAGASVALKFSPASTDSVARHRKGIHLGFAVAPSNLQYLGGGESFFGGAASFVFHFGITPAFELRSGVTAAFHYRGDDMLAQITAVVPIMLRFNYTPWFSAAAGLAGGFIYTVRPGMYPINQPGGCVGPEWSIFTMRGGDKRQYELSYAQGLRFGDTGTEYHHSLVFTYLSLD